MGINEIIDKAETAKATFYQHFPSKELLCEAWLDAVHTRSEVRCQRILEAPGKASEKIDCCFADLEAYLEASEFRGCPYSNTSAVVESGCTGILKQVEEHKQATREFFRALAADLASGLSGEECVERLGDALFVLYSGATTEAQNLRESGCTVIIAEQPGCANYDLAVSHGFEPYSLAEATAKGDLINILLPDEIQADLYREREP